MKNITNTPLSFGAILIILVSCSGSLKIENKKNWPQNKVEAPGTTIYSQEEFFQSEANQIISNKTGADNYANYLPPLKNKKIGIVTNQTGILSNKTHLVDFLLEKNIAVQKIFAP